MRPAGQPGGSGAAASPPSAAPSKRRTGHAALAPRPVAREGGGRGGNHRVVPSPMTSLVKWVVCAQSFAAQSCSTTNHSLIRARPRGDGHQIMIRCPFRDRALQNFGTLAPEGATRGHRAGTRTGQRVRQHLGAGVEQVGTAQAAVAICCCSNSNQRARRRRASLRATATMARLRPLRRATRSKQLTKA